MSKKGTYTALVPLRDGSKSIPLKNIKYFNNRPLCIWTLRAALDAAYIDDVWVSTDCNAIEEVIREWAPDVKIHRRPEDLAGDETPTEDVIRDWIAKAQISTENIITLQATSPQTSASDIEKAISQLEKENADSLVTGIRVHRFFWSDDGFPLNYDPNSRPMRQRWNGTVMENGAFYISGRKSIVAGESRLHGKIAVYVMDAFAGIELDEPEDWIRLEEEFRQRKIS